METSTKYSWRNLEVFLIDVASHVFEKEDNT